MSGDWMDDEKVTFPALALLRPTASVMWRLPFEVQDAVEDLAPETGMTGADWREHVVIPLYRDVIVPVLPVPVVATYAETGLRSPIRVISVDGDQVDQDALKRSRLLDRFARYECQVILPVRFLAEVLLGGESMQSLAGIPLDLITTAFEAGLRPREIRAQHAAGDLDPQSLSLMAGLRG